MSTQHLCYIPDNKQINTQVLIVMKATRSEEKTIIEESDTPITVKRYHFDVIDSTQTYAEQHYDLANEKQWCVFTADQQSAGRGQKDRQWLSPKGNLYATFVVPFMSGDNKPKRLPLWHISVYCVCLTLKTFGIEAQLKWRNDAVVDGRKISGSLVNKPIKITDNGNHKYSVIIGIGLNVNITPDIKDRRATSIKKELQAEQNISVKEVFAELQNIFVHNILIYQQKGFMHFLVPITKSLAFIGQMITVESQSDNDKKKTYTGKFFNITDQGRLVIDVDGDRVAIDSGRIIRTEHTNVMK